MTGPLELLKARQKEIEKALEAAEKNNLDEKETLKIRMLKNEYYSCVEILKNFKKTFRVRKKNAI